METKAIKAKRQLMVGKVVVDLRTLSDKAPAFRDDIDKLAKDVAMLMHQYATCAKGWDNDRHKVDELYNLIMQK